MNKFKLLKTGNRTWSALGSGTIPLCFKKISQSQPRHWQCDCLSICYFLWRSNKSGKSNLQPDDETSVEQACLWQHADDVRQLVDDGDTTRSQIQGQWSDCRAWKALPNNVRNKAGAIVELFQSPPGVEPGSPWLAATSSSAFQAQQTLTDPDFIPNEIYVLPRNICFTFTRCPRYKRWREKYLLGWISNACSLCVFPLQKRGGGHFIC